MARWLLLCVLASCGAESDELERVVGRSHAVDGEGCADPPCTPRYNAHTLCVGDKVCRCVTAAGAVYATPMTAATCAEQAPPELVGCVWTVSTPATVASAENLAAEILLTPGNDPPACADACRSVRVARPKSIQTTSTCVTVRETRICAPGEMTSECLDSWQCPEIPQGTTACVREAICTCSYHGKLGYSVRKRSGKSCEESAKIEKGASRCVEGWVESLPAADVAQACSHAKILLQGGAEPAACDWYCASQEITEPGNGVVTGDCCTAWRERVCMPK